MRRELYSDSIQNFLNADPLTILGQLTQQNDFELLPTQKYAWIEQIKILKKELSGLNGWVFFEFAIPRMGKRIDVLLIIGSVLFILEFKVGEREFTAHAIDQVWDYALDLKNFHETSHDVFIVPVTIATEAKEVYLDLITTIHSDNLFYPIRSTPNTLRTVIDLATQFCESKNIDVSSWMQGKYQPTPTIIEAAMALYNGHSVKEISRRDASAKNLTTTTEAINEIIKKSKKYGGKSICFVTGVPGAGKTLVGLNIATKNNTKENGFTSVFLSGNGPLVDILREALARDRVAHEKEKGNKKRISEARREVKSFIQNVHHFRDEYLIDTDAPKEHIALFDEAQRAWDLQQTANFMKRKKHIPNFDQSEPEFLISCLDRHADWAVIVCLVGGGQEINTGEAGISEWISALSRSFSNWNIYISDRLTDSEYGAGNILEEVTNATKIEFNSDLHLATVGVTYFL